MQAILNFLTIGMIFFAIFFQFFDLFDDNTLFWCIFTTMFLALISRHISSQSIFESIVSASLITVISATTFKAETVFFISLFFFVSLFSDRWRVPSQSGK